MTPSLQIFDFETQPVRVLEKDGQLWWVAADVCRVLDLSNPRQAIAGLDEDEKNTVTNADGINSGAGNPNLNTISESGLYALIFKSRKPEAKRFRKWVTAEVLPALRQHGRYEVPSSAKATDGAALSLISLFDYLRAKGVSLSQDMGFAGTAAAAAKAMGMKALWTESAPLAWKVYDQSFLDYLWEKTAQDRLLPPPPPDPHSVDRRSLWQFLAKEKWIMTDFRRLCEACGQLGLFKEWVPARYRDQDLSQAIKFGHWLAKHNGWDEAGIRLRISGTGRHKKFIPERSFTGVLP